jgi:type I restriction enzyme M protein
MIVRAWQVTHAGPAKQFHYMLANPPFGIEWKDQQKVVLKEHEELGFAGRFGAGFPRRMARR